MEDWEIRQIPFDLDREFSKSDRYLDEPEPTLYPYRVVVEVTETYSVDVLAESEEEAEDFAKNYLMTHSADTVFNYDDADCIESAELDEVDYFTVSVSEL